MRIVRDYQNIGADVRGAALALGNFDGMHRGHLAIIARTAAIAREQGLSLGAVTFEPHPRNVFSPDAPPFRLTPFRSKARLMQAAGVDTLFALRFNQALYRKDAGTFVQDVLVDGLAARHVVVGYDFAFGHKRSGNARVLTALGEKHGFGVTILEPVTHGDDVCSSTIIRVNLETGRARRAAELLGHWWEVTGRVRYGDQRGRQLGFPTANFLLGRDSLEPALGVYAVHIGLENGSAVSWLPGVANLGRRPTFGLEQVVLEVHLFDFDGDLYGRHARVAFVEFLRPEKKFDGLESLKKQIAEDGRAARALLAEVPNGPTAFELS